MERKVFFTLIHKSDSTGIKKVDGFKFSINDNEFYGYIDNEKNKVYIIDPKTGRSVYDLPNFCEYQEIDAIKHTVDSLMKDKHILEAFELESHTKKYKLMKEIFKSFLHGMELEEIEEMELQWKQAVNREILFRAKSLKSGTWTQGYLFRCWERAYIAWGMVNDNADMIEVDPETVCQYTGLTDKNGRKIFEGDICKDSENIVRILWNDKHQWGVEILKTDNVLSRGLIFPLWQYDNCKENGYRTLEVIGNIFDNPELLEGRQSGTAGRRQIMTKMKL